MKSLYELHFTDFGAQEREYEKRFNAPDAVHLNFYIGKHQAFFNDSGAYKIIASILRTDKQVEQLYTKLPGKAIEQFRRRCLIDEIVLTNNIEGVQSTRKEITDILDDLSKENKKNRFFGLVNKYFMLEKENISFQKPEDIRKIYDDIFGNEIEDLPDGEIFRKESVSVQSSAGREIHRGIYPEHKIIEAIAASLDFLNNTDVDILIRTAIFHYLLGYIHPFYDGNGRTSRFISSYLLSKELNSLIGYRISYTIKEHIKEYYDAFKICNSPYNFGDLTFFLEMFLSIVDTSEKQLYEALRKRLSSLNRYGNFIERFPSANEKNMNSLYYLLIQAALFSNMGIKRDELIEHLKISSNTLNKRFENMPEAFLDVKKDGKVKYYMLNLAAADEYIDTILREKDREAGQNSSAHKILKREK